MDRRVSPLYPLTNEQRTASDPDALAWLSASAGTGKTQVLTARVMRLLLSGVDPAAILCLTFTKAGAAEMADRIHARLAHWVRLKSPALARELIALGEAHDPDSVDEARKLFANVLDATGGGLRIQTIHAFAQSLLAAFPAEANIVPGFRPIEGREEALLIRETLAEMLVSAEKGRNHQLIEDIQNLSRRMGEEGAENFLRHCAHSFGALAALGAPELFADILRSALDLPAGDVMTSLVNACSDDEFDLESLNAIAQANREWGTKTGLEAAEKIARWISAGAAQRAVGLKDLREVWATKQGGLRTVSKKLAEAEPRYGEITATLDDAVARLLALEIKSAYAEFAAAGLRAGRHFAEDYAIAKRRKGVLDFNDMINLVRALLAQPGIGEWVRYKLDQGIDHILVDEAQDTNDAQWSIIEGLSAEFFETEPGATDSIHRTIFAVGDFKQAIFGFQGTNPQAFTDARDRFAEHIAARDRTLSSLSLDKSYRSSTPILEVVDTVMENIGASAVGLPDALRAHVSAYPDRPGQVSLLAPVRGEAVDDLDPGEEGWLADAKLALARKLAQQIKSWITDGPEQMWLASRARGLRPEDVLILVRSRGELASLLVARLHEENVPVAGVDRLMLTDPLAVQDLLAALRFVLQPEDELNLANVLVSPLIGWSQDELYALSFQRKSNLWSILRDKAQTHSKELGSAQAAVNSLQDLLDRGDFISPYQLLEHILSGPMQGRRKLLARLGNEARDPIDELLNAALLFEAENPPSLQHFLDWFDRGDAEIKRDPAAPLDAVRVMTVHGAKGLQAPLVILADATFDPNLARSSSIDFTVSEDKPAIPLPRPRKIEQVDMLADAVDRQQRADREEHWRLLYVALTRAEEQLVVTGALGPRQKDGPPAESWYAAVEQAMKAIAPDAQDDPIWSHAIKYRGSQPIQAQRRRAAKPRTPLPVLTEPDWLSAPAPMEERPPKPLAPSSLGDDLVAEPPPSEAMQLAAERGRLMHSLFERLPDVAPTERRAAALDWLEKTGGLVDEARRAEIVDAALGVINNTEFAEIFSSDALAEAPIAAIVGEAVVAGTVDRLLVSDTHVHIVDFKTGHRVPANVADAPLAHIRQMAAYAAALQTVFPDRTVKASLLYSAGPHLLTLTEDQIQANKPGLAPHEQSLSHSG